MKNSEKLKEWYDDQRENHGLEDCHLSLSPDVEGDVEGISGDILEAIANLDLTSPLEGI